MVVRHPPAPVRKYRESRAGRPAISRGKIVRGPAKVKVRRASEARFARVSVEHELRRRPHPIDSLRDAAEDPPMPPGSDEKGGGIRWQTEDAADALLSDIMSEVSQDADAERAALEAARREKEEAERQAREDAERRQNTEIEQRLREEQARRAAADEQRQRLAREAEIARAVADGEVGADAAHAALTAPDEPTVDETESGEETRPDTGGFDDLTAPQATTPLRPTPLGAPAACPPATAPVP